MLPCFGFSPDSSHQWVGEWQNKWGKVRTVMKGAVQHKCYCNGNLLPALDFFFFTISCVWLREQTPDDEGNSQPSGIQSHTASSLVRFHCCIVPSPRASTHSEAQTPTANERTIGLPLGRYAYTRNSIYITLNTITVVYFMFSVLFLYIWWF